MTNRIVILLGPIFVGLSGWIATLAAKYLPGHPHLDKGQLTIVFGAGALYAITTIAKWLHGWQKYEARADKSMTHPGDFRTGPLPARDESDPSADYEGPPERPAPPGAFDVRD